MKIAIIGAGAIGGLVGAKLALAGEDVTFIVRGANLDAIRNNGIKLVLHDGSEQVARNVAATNDYAAAGVQDLVILAMKAHQLEAVVDDLPKLIGPDTLIVTMQNGLPFWYFHEHGGALAGSQLKSVDPSGRIGAAIPARQIIGCVVYPAVGAGGAGRDQAHRGRAFPAGRARRQHQRARAAHCRQLRQGRLQEPGAGQHPRRDLAQAVGQPDLQPDQQPGACHAGGHLPVPADARAGRSR